MVTQPLDPLQTLSNFNLALMRFNERYQAFIEPVSAEENVALSLIRAFTGVLDVMAPPPPQPDPQPEIYLNGEYQATRVLYWVCPTNDEAHEVGHVLWGPVLGQEHEDGTPFMQPVCQLCGQAGQPR